MKKRAVICLCLVLAVLLGMCIGAGAAGGLETISAYLAYNTTVKLDGITQTLYDANGKRVYPINYQGTTYLPVRAVSGLFDVDVNWDGATKTVLLGKPGKAVDFIDSLEPSGGKTDRHYSTTDNQRANIAGEFYNHYIYMFARHELYYDLGGNYETLSFMLYGDYDHQFTMSFYGDNNELLEEISFMGKQPPKTYTVDVSGVTQLRIYCHRDFTYLYHATIE